MFRAPPTIACCTLLALTFVASGCAGAKPAQTTEASATRPARTAEAQGIFAAIQRRAPMMPIACLPLRIKVSTTHSAYASATVSRRLQSCAWGDGSYLLLHTGTRWAVVAEGSEHACSEAPRAVLKDLFGGCV